MAAHREASACCAGVFTRESQLCSSFPCRMSVAGRATCPYTSSTTIWQSHSVVPWCGHGQSAIPKRAACRSNVCNALSPRLDRRRRIQRRAASQERSTDQKGMMVFTARITISRIIGTCGATPKRRLTHPAVGRIAYAAKRPHGAGHLCAGRL